MEGVLTLIRIVALLNVRTVVDGVVKNATITVSS
jgi:hypothetical protein